MANNNVDLGDGYADPNKLFLTKNIRADFDDDADFGLFVAGIQERIDAGEEPIIQPITWYYKAGRPYVYVGHRRVRAAQILGIKVPHMKVDPPATNAERIITQLAENDDSFRKDIDPISKAKAFRDALASDPTMTQKDFAKRMKKSGSYISQHLAMLGLPQHIQDLVASGKMQVAVAYDVKTKFTPAQIKDHSDEIIERSTEGSQAQCRKALTRYASFIDETVKLFGSIPTSPAQTEQPPDAPKPPPVDETTERIKSMLDMASGMIQKAKEEAAAASIDLMSALDKLAKEIVKEAS